MGSVISQLVEAVKDVLFTQPCRVVMLGLDGAGKTSILYKLKLGGAKPTACYNVETINYKRVKFTIFDISGNMDVRPAWPCYFPECDAIIFVVDASDRSRVDEAARELTKILNHEDMKAAKLLVLANKQDKPHCMTVDELRDRLEITARIAHRVEKSIAATGEGIYEGLDWLCEEAAATEDGFGYVAVDSSKNLRATH